MRHDGRMGVACIYYTMKQGGGGQMSVRSLVRGVEYPVTMDREPPEIDLSGMRVLPPPLSRGLSHGTQGVQPLNSGRCRDHCVWESGEPM